MSTWRNGTIILLTRFRSDLWMLPAMHIMLMDTPEAESIWVRLLPLCRSEQQITDLKISSPKPSFLDAVLCPNHHSSSWHCYDTSHWSMPYYEFGTPSESSRRSRLNQQPSRCIQIQIRWQSDARPCRYVQDSLRGIATPVCGNKHQQF